MSYANETMHERDADLGYIKMYLKEIHEFLDAGGVLCKRTSLLIRQSHETMLDAFGSFMGHDKNKAPDKEEKT